MQFSRALRIDRRRRSAMLVLALLMAITSVVRIIPPEVLACVTSGGSGAGQDEVALFTHTSTCDYTPSGNQVSTGTYRLVPQCFYAGSHTWGDPRNNDVTGSPKWTNSVLSETTGSTPAWAQAWERRIRSDYNSGQDYMSSFFWRNKYADLLAAMMQIRRTGGSWQLYFTTEAQRTIQLTSNIYFGPIMSTGALLGNQSYFRSQGSPSGFNSGRSIDRIALTGSGTQINALAWPFGINPVLPNFGAPTPLGSIFIAGRVRNDSIGRIMALGGGGNYFDLMHLLWPSANAQAGLGFQDYRGGGTENARNVWSWSTDRGYPFRVWVETDPNTSRYNAYTYAAFRTRYLNGEFEPGVKYNVEVYFNNARPLYTRSEVLAGFRAVVAAQVATQWNQFSPTSGSGAPRGGYYIPVMANGPDCTNEGINIGGFSVDGGRGRVDPTCTADRLRSDAGANSVAQPDRCYLFWQFKRETPPKLTQQQFSTILNQGFSSLRFKPSVAFAIVNQPVTFELIPGQQTQWSYNDDLGAGSGIVINYNLTQVGTTMYMGSAAITSPLAARARTANDPTNNYRFTYTFTQTPSSRMQDEPCVTARSAQQLKDLCGIVLVPTSGGEVEPRFVVSFATWWDGEYEFTGAGISSGWRGIFAEEHSTISAAVRAQILPWQPTWNAVQGAVSFSRDPRSNSGARLTSTPSRQFGTRAEQLPDQYGAPMYRNTCTAGSFTASGSYNPGSCEVVLPVMQVQPGETN